MPGTSKVLNKYLPSEQMNKMKDFTVVTANKWEWESGEGRLDVPCLYCVDFFCYCTTFIAKQNKELRKACKRKRNCRLHPKTCRDPGGACGWAAESQPSPGSWRWGKPWNPPHSAPAQKRGTYCNTKTLIRGNWKWKLVSPSVSRLLVNYVQVLYQILGKIDAKGQKNRH